MKYVEHKTSSIGANKMDLNSLKCSSKRKKLILLDSDFKYSLRIERAAKRIGIDLIATSNLSAFMVEVTKNEDQLLGVIVNQQFILDMHERSLFCFLEEQPFIVIDNKPYSSKKLMDCIPVLDPIFVSKNLGIITLLDKIISENDFFSNGAKFVKIAQA